MVAANTREITLIINMAVMGGLAAFVSLVSLFKAWKKTDTVKTNLKNMKASKSHKLVLYMIGALVLGFLGPAVEYGITNRLTTLSAEWWTRANFDVQYSNFVFFGAATAYLVMGVYGLRVWNEKKSTKKMFYVELAWYLELFSFAFLILVPLASNQFFAIFFICIGGTLLTVALISVGFISFTAVKSEDKGGEGTFEFGKWSKTVIFVVGLWILLSMVGMWVTQLMTSANVYTHLYQRQITDVCVVPVLIGLPILITSFAYKHG